MSDYQVCLTAPQDSNTFKNSIKGGRGKLIQSYSFTKILKPELSQKDLFSSLVCPMVQDFMEGQNQLLFTYGATSAGIGISRWPIFLFVIGNKGIKFFQY